MGRDRRHRRQIVGGTFAVVIRQFMESAKFQGLAPMTRTMYGHWLSIAQLPESLGIIPTEDMRPALVQAFLDGLADRPAAQKSAQTALRSLEKWALVRDLLPRPITLGTEAPGSTGGHVPWTDEQVAFAEMNTQPHISRVITLAANTGQRGSDLVKMRWTDIEVLEARPGINVTQQKTGLKLWLPFTAALQEAITTWERRPGFILLKKDGMPWRRQQVSDQWLHERNTSPALAPLKAAGLVMHGLRATAVVRLRRAGATIPQISDMVGLSPPMVTRYCRFSEQQENALAAVHILDRTSPRTGAERVRNDPSKKGS
jgi:integrase